MNTAPQVIDITDAIVAKGQRAWTRIKATTEEQRLLWLEIGNALSVGRMKNPSNQKFSQWCKDHGFGDIAPDTRSAAMRLSAIRPEMISELEAGITHPVAILALIRKQELTGILPEELQSVTPEATTVLPERDGERVAKTILRANSKGEGSDIAKKHLDGLARKHGTTVEGLTEAAKAAAPETYFQFGPAQVEAIQDLYANQRNTVAAMVAYGFTREEIKNVFLKFTNSI